MAIKWTAITGSPILTSKYAHSNFHYEICQLRSSVPGKTKRLTECVIAESRLATTAPQDRGESVVSRWKRRVAAGITS